MRCRSYRSFAKGLHNAAALYTHHQYIRHVFLRSGCLSLTVRSSSSCTDPERQQGTIVLASRCSSTKKALIISHLSWYPCSSRSPFPHPAGLYVHTTRCCPGSAGLRSPPESRSRLEPVLFLRSVRFKHSSGQVASTAWMSSCRMPDSNCPRPRRWLLTNGASGPAWLDGAINSANPHPRWLACRSAPGDSLSSPRHRPWDCTIPYHLDSWSRVHSTPGVSKLMPDKKRTSGYSFPCDGPGLSRAAPCDISAWHAFYHVGFPGPQYRRWGHLLLALEAPRHLAGNVAQFNESSTYLMGWFRALTSGSTAPQPDQRLQPVSGRTNLARLAWMFLFSPG